MSDACTHTVVFPHVSKFTWQTLAGIPFLKLPASYCFSKVCHTKDSTKRRSLCMVLASLKEGSLCSPPPSKYNFGNTLEMKRLQKKNLISYNLCEVAQSFNKVTKSQYRSLFTMNTFPSRETSCTVMFVTVRRRSRHSRKVPADELV